jgi:uncharacterized protein (DUF1330 family)|tara:strand:- start:4017 stop:4448 length:432 start_codon:yes stop_codon:yes gene_type:complete
MHQMHITNEVSPSDPDQLAQLGEPGPDGPIYMVNLLKFKERAGYEDGRETDLTGAEAYGLYGSGVVPLVAEHGGRLVFSGAVSWLMLGQADDMWDQVAVVEYPNRGALLAMATSPAYAEIAVHRNAGLAGQLNIETTGLSVPN